MYSDKENVNILTALLAAHGVRLAVLCPGSRNAPICHNLFEDPHFTCFPVTDERSAGFFALGLSMAEDQPVAVCVTSGSALLNVAPAVAEAMYQHRKLVVISADRPAAFIDQLQGQTLSQPDALTHLVRKAVSIPEPHDATERWHCNRLVNEALMEMRHGEEGPVHINVPLSEPLFNFNVERLPEERVVRLTGTPGSDCSLEPLTNRFAEARRPMVLIGQARREQLEISRGDIQTLRDYGVLLCEPLGCENASEPLHLEEMLIRLEGREEDFLPDFVVYMGGTFVSKRLKAFLRKTAGATTCIVNADGRLCDVSTHATDVVQTDIPSALAAFARAIRGRKPTDFHCQWERLRRQASEWWRSHSITYSQLFAVAVLQHVTSHMDCEFHYANSMAVRLGNIYSNRYIHVNRGVNGIEGSLSTAVGFAARSRVPVFCVIGDLSFFYDQNALWNRCLSPRLRILLLNNGGGGIFKTLPGLKESAACNTFVAAAHHTTAEGICLENDVTYLAAHNDMELVDALNQLTDPDARRPMVLEVFTDANEDKRVLDSYYYGDPGLKAKG